MTDHAAYMREWRVRNHDRAIAIDRKSKSQRREARLAEMARYREGHREELRMKAKEYRLNHLEERALYRKTHAKEAEVVSREWNAKNRDRLREQMRAYKAAHRSMMNEYQARRRARQSQTIASDVLERDLGRLRNRFQGCAYCGAPGPLEMDHVIPLSRGGQHSIGNLLPACRSCNRSKGAKLLVEWLGRP